MEVFLIRTLVMGVLLLLVAKIVPGIEMESFGKSLLAALVLGLANAVVAPLLIILTLPITFLTLGLFLLVINALMLKLSAAIVSGFEVNGFWPALAGSALLAIFSAGFSLLF